MNIEEYRLTDENIPYNTDVHLDAGVYNGLYREKFIEGADAQFNKLLPLLEQPYKYPSQIFPTKSKQIKHPEQTNGEAVEKIAEIIKECGSYSIGLDGYVLNPTTAACKLHNVGYHLSEQTNREAVNDIAEIVAEIWLSGKNDSQVFDYHECSSRQGWIARLYALKWREDG